VTLSDLATEPEIQIAPETLQRLLFKPQDYVGVAEVALSEDHDYDIGHPHSACGRGYPPSRVGHVSTLLRGRAGGSSTGARAAVWCAP